MGVQEDANEAARRVGLSATATNDAVGWWFSRYASELLHPGGVLRPCTRPGRWRPGGLAPSAMARLRLGRRGRALLQLEPCADVSISAAARPVISTGGGGAPIDFFSAAANNGTRVLWNILNGCMRNALN